jgi:mycofactocin precursor
LTQQATMEAAREQEELAEVSLPAEENRPAELIADELLVEEVSIDGMCGVY